VSSFVCAACGGIFEEDETAQAEAEEECRTLWAAEIAAGARLADFDTLCDDCFRKFMAWFQSESGIVRPGGYGMSYQLPEPYRKGSSQ